MNDKKYYTAYEERYKIAHSKGVSWTSDKCSPIVIKTIQKYNIKKNQPVLEIGCGEGRDAKAVLKNGYNLTAIDVSEEAVNYCKKIMPACKNSFSVMDCLSQNLYKSFDFIYSVAVLHMLITDEDRNKFYRFIYKHLNTFGYALICTMGDGKFEMQSDIHTAFDIVERQHASGKMMVPATSCRMVSFKTLQHELQINGFKIIEHGITSSLPDFNSLMYVVATAMRAGLLTR